MVQCNVDDDSAAALKPEGESVVALNADVSVESGRRVRAQSDCVCLECPAMSRPGFAEEKLLSLNPA